MHGSKPDEPKNYSSKQLASHQNSLSDTDKTRIRPLVKKNWIIDKDGYASLPEGTGLCCEVDEAKLAELAKLPIVPEWPKRGRMPDGSIADY